MDALVEMLLVSSQLQSGSFEIVRTHRRPRVDFEACRGRFGRAILSLDVDPNVVLRIDRLLIKRAISIYAAILRNTLQ